MSSLVHKMRKLSTDIRVARKEGEDDDIIQVMQDERASVMKVFSCFVNRASNKNLAYGKFKT
jgi:hypothetical protein